MQFRPCVYTCRTDRQDRQAISGIIKTTISKLFIHIKITFRSPSVALLGPFMSRNWQPHCFGQNYNLLFMLHKKKTFLNQPWMGQNWWLIKRRIAARERGKYWSIDESSTSSLQCYELCSGENCSFKWEFYLIELSSNVASNWLPSLRPEVSLKLLYNFAYDWVIIPSINVIRPLSYL